VYTKKDKPFRVVLALEGKKCAGAASSGPTGVSFTWCVMRTLMRYMTVLLSLGCAGRTGGLAVQFESTNLAGDNSGTVAPPTETPSKPKRATIGRLRLRDAEVEIQASQGDRKGLQFRVFDRHGKALYSSLTETELEARCPELTRAFRSSIAQEHPFLDARVYVRAIQPRTFLEHTSGDESLGRTHF